MNPGNASRTGASSKVAPFSPPVKPRNTVHVRTVFEIPDPVGEFGSDGGTVHTPDVQCASSSPSNAGVQSGTLKPLKGWERSVPHIGAPKVKLPSGVSCADEVCTNKPAASKIAVCGFIVLALASGVRSVALRAVPKVLGLQSAGSTLDLLSLNCVESS
jgi:hypothetical protein